MYVNSLCMPILSHFFKHIHWHTRIQPSQPKWKSLNSDTHTWVFEPIEFHLHEYAILITGNTLYYHLVCTILANLLFYHILLKFSSKSLSCSFLVSFFSLILISTFLLHYCFLWPFKEIFAYLQVMKMVCCVCLFWKALWFKPLNLGL